MTNFKKCHRNSCYLREESSMYLYKKSITYGPSRFNDDRLKINTALWYVCSFFSFTQWSEVRSGYLVLSCHSIYHLLNLFLLQILFTQNLIWALNQQGRQTNKGNIIFSSFSQSLGCKYLQCVWSTLGAIHKRRWHILVGERGK